MFPDPLTEKKPLSVSEVTRNIKCLLEDAFPSLAVEGQVSGLSRPQSGHVYFSLKDETAGWPAVEIVVRPVSVQGPGAALEIAAAIALANRLHDGGRLTLDGAIVGRGGGSLEDLWAFNEEILADAIFASRVVIVSGVGHETD